MSEPIMTVDSRVCHEGNRIAVRDGERTFTYDELHQRANVMADWLVTAGVQPGDAVVIALERGFSWISSILAVLRAGAAYVPVDTGWGDERLRFILSDSHASAAIGNAELLGRIGCRSHDSYPAERNQGIHPTGLDPASVAWQNSAEKAVPEIPGAAAERLAYVIYTSGSTGAPKGVEITHTNLNHLIDWHLEAFSVTHEDVASHVAGLGFDAAGWEVWPYLVAGAAITVAHDDVRRSAITLRDWMVQQRVTIGFAPTALAGDMITEAWPVATALRTLLTGGEALHKNPISGLPFTVFNNYGPTECTVVATSGALSVGPGQRPSIGAPIRGTTIYILAEDGQALPDGQGGEIVIGGGSVGRGYRNMPETTAGSFVLDRFSTVPGARMYLTGDRGRRAADGSIDFLGRVDRQTKIRGHRVELDEISAVLHRHPAVRFATVVASDFEREEGTGETRLIAYVLPREQAQTAPLTARELQQFLLLSLPSYMLPALYVQLDAVPLTPNGKLDETLLPRPTGGNALALSPELGRKPGSVIEQRLLEMVKTVLATDAVTVEDDFFLVGGHSLRGTQLVLRIRSAFGIDLPLRALFETPSVEGLSITVENLIRADLEEMSEEEAEEQAAKR